MGAKVWLTTAMVAAGLGVPAVALGQVDLEPATMQIDSDPAASRVTVTVRNAPAAVATVPAGQLVRLFDGVPGTTNILGTVSTTQPLAPGQQETVAFELGAGFSFVGAGGVARQLYVRTDPSNTLGETNEANNENFAYRWREGLNPPVPRQHRVLVVNVNSSSYNSQGALLRDTVIQAGGAVSFQTLSSQNQVANLIANNTYDQIWVYDLSSTADAYTNDWTAIANWFNADPSRDVIADGRIIATLWNGWNTSQGRLISDNYYENFRIRGGGLMLGTDHGGSGGPTNSYAVFHMGINDINDRIGIGRFWGNPGGSVAGMPATDPNPLRNIPNNLAFSNGGVLGVRSDSSPGNAPTGFQDSTNIAPGRVPLARTFYTLAWHNGTSGGGASTPAISTTMAGTLGFTVAINAPCRTPLPGASNVLTAQVSAGAVTPVTYEWRSNVQGLLGTGASINTAGLSAGEHLVSLTVRDASGFRPGATARVVVGGADCTGNCLPDDEDISSGRSADTRPANGIPDLCEDADHDLVLDIDDPAPCDPRVVAEAFSPAENSRGMIAVEDQWPGRSDLDFNDVVSAYNYHYLLSPDGRVVALRATFDVLALGGTYTMGFGLSLPVAPGSVASVSRSVNAGAPESLVLRSDGARAVLWVSPNLRELFGFQDGAINSIPGGAAAAAQQIAIDISFAAPVALPISAQPFDVFVFHDHAAAHEIHRPIYAGTEAMDTTLFGRGIDASTEGRWFVDQDGLPYVLDLAALSPWPAEGTPIETLYPDIIPWAASGGTTNQSWQSNQAGGAYAPAPPPRMVFPYPADTSCL